MPAQRKKAEADIANAKFVIEGKLVPKGEAVTRHTTLPTKWHSEEWIMTEMAKMDSEIAHAEWKHGKISGAVYRTSRHYIAYGDSLWSHWVVLRRW